MSAKLQNLRFLYRTAESFIDEVTNIESEITLPARDELRLAGSNLLDALADEGVIANDHAVEEAEKRCENAINHALTAGVDFVSTFDREFRHTYRTIVISEVIADYGANREALKKAQHLIETGRPDQTPVGEYATQCIQALREIRGVVPRLEAHRDDLNVKVRKERTQHLFAILGIVIGLLAVILAAIRLLTQLSGCS